MVSAPSVLIFDVNETLLDIDALAPHFEDVFGDGAVLRTWFGELVMHSMALTLSSYYVDFSTLGRAVLQMVATTRGVELTDDAADRIGEAMRTMPAHPDASPGLERLQGMGYRLVTLTNSPHRAGAPTPLEHAGLGDYFETQFTVDDDRVFKPAQQLYRRVASELGVPVAECVLVAAHTWDVIGAQGAGMQSALLTRPGNAPLVVPGVPSPTFVAANVVELADLLPVR